MSSDNISYRSVAFSSACGVLRGGVVNLIVSPLDVIKTTQQSLVNSEANYKIAIKLFKEGGFSAFYRGLYPQMIKTGFKQLWSWPIITALPKYLERHRFSTTSQQAITGLTIATVDVTLTTPLERARVNSIVNETRITLKSLYLSGFKGFWPFWMKQTVSWTVFLLAQKLFRDQAHEKSHHENLSFFELLTISTKVSLVASFVTAPFDLANTLKQTQNLHFSNFASTQSLVKMLRCWPLTAATLMIHNLASIALLEMIDKK